MNQSDVNGDASAEDVPHRARNNVGNTCGVGATDKRRGQAVGQLPTA